MENDPFVDKILTLGFLLSIMPEVMLECVQNAVTWIDTKVDDALDVW